MNGSFTVKGSIERIRIFPAKGEAGRELAEAMLIENQGLEGGFHAAGGKRQITLLGAETREELSAQKEKGICFSRFKENITIRGLAPNALQPGVYLAAGDAVIEMTDEVKRCHEECPLHAVGRRCPLAGKSLFAKVIKGGIIHVGDAIT